MGLEELKWLASIAVRYMAIRAFAIIFIPRSSNFVYCTHINVGIVLDAGCLYTNGKGKNTGPIVVGYFSAFWPDLLWAIKLFD